MSKSKAQKGFDGTDVSRYDLSVDLSINVVLSVDPMLDMIFGDIVQL